MTVRSATTNDLREVALWISTRRDAELWAGWRVAFPIESDSLPAQIEFSEANAFSLVAEGKLVAFGQLVAKDARRGHLARIIVSPDERKQGHGQVLVRALLDHARLRECERVGLNVDGANAAAMTLYLKMGFTDAPRPSDEPATAGTRYLDRTI